LLPKLVFVTKNSPTRSLYQSSIIMSLAIMILNRWISQSLAIVSFVLRPVYTQCCYSLTSQSASAQNYDLDILAESVEKGSKNGFNYNILISFPSEYVTNQNPPSMCTNTGVPNIYSCSSKGVPMFRVKWRVSVPPALTGKPTVNQLSINSEQCAFREQCSTTTGTGTPKPADEGPPTVNLGPLGDVPETTFYPVLIGIILAFLGIGFVAYTRSGKRVVSDDEERQMTSGGNGAGWFGEDKSKYKEPTVSNTDGFVPNTKTRDSKNKVGNKGVRRSSSKNDRLRESDESKRRSRRQEKMDKQRKMKQSEREEKVGDRDDETSDSDEDMSRVVSRRPVVAPNSRERRTRRGEDTNNNRRRQKKKTLVQLE
jgi:hypothetical protein